MPTDPITTRQTLSRAELIANLEDLRDRALNEAAIMSETIALLGARHPGDLEAAASVPGFAVTLWDEYCIGCGDRMVEAMPPGLFDGIVRPMMEARRPRAEITEAVLRAETEFHSTAVS